MRGRDPARPERKRAHTPSTRAESYDQGRGCDDVRDRVPRAHFGESDALSRDTVRSRLGRRKMPKNRERMIAHGPVEIRVAEAGADLGPGPVIFISVRMDVVRAGIMPMRML